MSEEEIKEQINEIVDYLGKKESEDKSHGNVGVSTGFGQSQSSIVEWQLDLSKEFELIHHQLRGHIIKRKPNSEGGGEYWAEPDDPEQKLLNEKGAQEVEKVIRNYLNKNTLLSNFDLKTINHRVGQFAHRLRRFIYLNYEEFGLDSDYKQKHFEMLVMNIVDMVESAYYRALNGGERQSLTSVRQIIQQETYDGRQNQQMMPTQMNGTKLNPLNWFK